MADSKIDFLYLSEEDMLKAGVNDVVACTECMEELLITMDKGDYLMGGENGNSHGTMVTFPDDPPFPNMPKNGPDRRFMAMPAYVGGQTDMAGMKWYGSNVENRDKGLPRSILMVMLNDKDTGAPLALMSEGVRYRRSGCYQYHCDRDLCSASSDAGYPEDQGKRKRVHRSMYQLCKRAFAAVYNDRSCRYT